VPRCTIAAREPGAPAEPRRQRLARAGTALATPYPSVRFRTMAFALLVAARVAGAAPTVLVRVGDRSPLGLPFSRFSEPAVDDRGRIAFVGGRTVLFRRGAGGIQRIAGADDALLDHRLAGVSPAAVGPDGCVAFRAAFADGGAGVFLRCGDTTTLVLATGTVAPGGGTFAGLGNDVASASGGRVVFTATLGDGGAGIFLADGAGGFTDVVRTGSVSPAGGTFTTVRLIGISAAGRVGFRGAISGGPDGFFFWDTGVLAKVAVVGDASPAGGSFTRVGQGAMNDGDMWSFRATISNGVDPDRTGLFRATPTGFGTLLTSVVMDGDATPIGGTFANFPNSLVPVINASGSIAFRATLADAPFPSGVFVAQPDGTLLKAAAVGEPNGSAGQVLVRLREVSLADDGGVVIRASLLGGTPGLFRSRGGSVETLALLGDATDAGGGFRFTDAAVRGSADDAVFLGAREGLFVVDASGAMQSVAVLGDRTPLRGQYAGFDQPAAGGGRIVFGASIQGGRSGEALLAARRADVAVLAKVGERARPCGQISDLFTAADDLARPGVGAGTVVFQTALAGGGAASGIVLWSGGALRAVACEGKKAPGGGKFRTFGTPAAGSGGRFAFDGVAGDPSGTLFRAEGGRVSALAASGRDTQTRLQGTFRGFAPPAASGAAVAFRALLDHGREGIFVARGRCTMAIAGSGDAEPGGGRFRSFGAPAFAGSAVVFRATAVTDRATLGIYRVTPSGTCTQDTPSVEALATAGPAFLDFGAPTGNRKGVAAFAVDLTGGGATDAIVVDRGGI